VRLLGFGGIERLTFDLADDHVVSARLGAVATAGGEGNHQQDHADSQEFLLMIFNKFAHEITNPFLMN
jgi:hypothetical protein